MLGSIPRAALYRTSIDSEVLYLLVSEMGAVSPSPTVSFRSGLLPLLLGNLSLYRKLCLVWIKASGYRGKKNSIGSRIIIFLLAG